MAYLSFSTCERFTFPPDCKDVNQYLLDNPAGLREYVQTLSLCPIDEREKRAGAPQADPAPRVTKEHLDELRTMPLAHETVVDAEPIEDAAPPVLDDATKAKMEADPLADDLLGYALGQCQEIADKHPEEAARMEARFAEYERQMADYRENLGTWGPWVRRPRRDFSQRPTS